MGLGGLMGVGYSVIRNVKAFNYATATALDRVRGTVWQWVYCHAPIHCTS